jgi:alkanesulfonate monooxygenase SsuD/methylene tetrahydromethanopterin reductase-like flavin-dependent oxidoreductase (luciferase family)
MLDVMSGGRLVAGLPVGLSYDANLNNGIPTVETRDRYREAVELVMRAWAEDEPFTWNGRFSQYSLVNPWPRPLQRPRPPVMLGGAGRRMQWTIRVTPSSTSAGSGQLTAHHLRPLLGTRRPERDRAQPYRVGFVQNVVVAETDAAPRSSGATSSAFRQGSAACLEHYLGLPGYVDRRIETLLRDPGDLGLAELSPPRSDGLPKQVP